MNNVQVIGMEDLNRKLNEFEDKIARKHLKDSLREVARPIVATIKGNISSKAIIKTRRLFKSIGVWFFKNINEVYIGPRTGKRSKYDAWYAHFQEFGTSGHGKRTRIDTWDKGLARNAKLLGKSVASIKTGRKAGSYRITTGYAKSGGGITARPFMRPAWDQHKGTILENLRIVLKSKLGL